MSPGVDSTESARRTRPLLVLLVALGVVAFLYGISRPQAANTWAIYLVNLLFWSGLAITGPAVAAMIQVTEGRWSPTVKRMAVTTIGFLPASAVFFVVLFLGRAELYPWVTHPVEKKVAWLNVPFMTARIGIGVLLLYWVAFALARAVFAEDPAGQDPAAVVGRKNRLSTILLMLYVVVLSLWGFDLIMSLDPIWYSGLLGGYFVVSCLYTGFGLVTFLILRANERGTTNVPPSAIQDAAKLTFAMSIVWMYFFFSQYLIIWYGNVPPETRFFLRRFLGNQPWGYLAWAIFIVGWLIPFSYLLKRLTGRPPTRHKVLKVILWMGWIAIFFERVLLVFPSISKSNEIPHGVTDILITAGFFSLFVLSRDWLLGRYRPALNLPR
jgi:Ni/Fe-hydrogenase subunit HybB-like protein